MTMWRDYQVEYFDNGRVLLDRRVSRLDELLSFRALERPEQKQFALLGDGESVTESLTFRQAHDWACKVAGLLARFAPEGSRILLCFENGMAAIAGFFGCSYANMVPVSGVYPTAVGSVERLFYILEDSEAVAVLGPRDTLMDFRRQAAGRAKAVKWIPIEGAEQVEPLYRRRAAEMDDVALVQYTSGSVGQPRGVQITHRNLGVNLSLLLDRTGFFDGSLGLSWLPLSHDMGLVIGLLIGVVAGGPCWLMTPQHFIEKPERWLAAISRYRVGFSAGPNFAYELLAHNVPEEALKGLDLSCWKRSVIGAEMIEQESVAHFLERFAPYGVEKTLLRPGYGMAETTLMIASGGKQGHEVVTFERFSRMGLAAGRVEAPQHEYDGRVLASCGKVIEGHNICVVEPETGEPLPDGRVGELWLTGPSVSPGYLNREQENKERFGLDIASMPEGKSWFRSRDMGFFYEGQLYLTGRAEHSLFIDGQYFDPDDLAQAIRTECSAFSSRAVAVFHGETEICVVGELSTAQAAQADGHNALLEAMARAVGRICPLQRLRCVLVRQGGIQRTPSGKIRMKATAQALSDEMIPVVRERLFGADELRRVEILFKAEQPL